MVILKYLLAGILSFSVLAGNCQEAGSAQAFFEKGLTFSQNHEVQKAYTFFIKSLNQSQSEKNWNLFVKSLNELGSINSLLNGSQQAELFERAKGSFQLLKGYPENSDLAQLHQYTGDYYSNL